ncbi:leucocin A/sakacin P family class II bacteriocin [Listeria aquatica]|uniref:PapA n=1 Tax=Listeria aquatica FSL S10-1188 TaxID=1265818 RepID=W7BE23_9LIST|nr:leucocin A/sakacin P family class II bacteriocin [Listeria aquatica]EUJ18023.1 PapA [Listeria aquatica FSL S10-1188]
MKNMTRLDSTEMAKTIGGKYYGNGVSCNKKKCSVDWGKTIGIIGNNSAANLATGGAAGWNK